MKWYEAAGIGVLMGCLYGVTLWASVQVQSAYYVALEGISLRPAFDTSLDAQLWNAPTVQVYNHSRMITPDPNMVYMPFEVTGVIMIIAFATLFSIPYWYPYAEKWFDQFASDVLSGWNKK